MSEPKLKNRFASLASLLLLVVMVAVFIVVVFHRQYLVDQYIMFQYRPTAEAVSLRESLKLTPLGERYYNASQVVIESSEKFNQSCKQHAETNNPILGCYAAQRIYVYQITNEKLRGIEETTAAHELLHAVYERMNDSDKARIDSALRQAYERLKTPELEDRMAYYEKTEPGQELNELHSILGSEQPGLGETLEQHYAQYFQDRTFVLQYYNAYSSVFQSTSNQLKELEVAINQSTSAVNVSIEQYNRAVSSLQSDSQAFNDKNQRGEFTSPQEFNAEREVLIGRQAELDEQRNLINGEIERINQERNRYNALVSEYDDLNRSINSSLVPLSPSLN